MATDKEDEYDVSEIYTDEPEDVPRSVDGAQDSGVPREEDDDE